ncbi:Ribonuclease Z, mitochondrial, partial [Habropoda laboriosa]
QIIGSGAPGTPACVFLVTDQRNYLFNCGEGTQRLSQEYHCKLSKLENIFLTNISWKNVGGLPGLLLTAQDNGSTTMNIHSPEGMDIFTETIKKFTYLGKLKISYFPTNEFEVYRDHVMTVSYVNITKSSKSIEECSLDMEDKKQYYSNLNGKRVIDNEVEMNKEKKIKSLPRVMCYICEIHPRRGKLLIDKCINFGLPPGPLLTLLKQGLNVTKEDGTIVHSKDVCLPDSPKTTFIALNEQNIEVFCILHFTPEKVFTDQRYQNWIANFPSKVEHIILNNENTCMGSEAVHKNQYLLNTLHPEIFPLLNKNWIKEDENIKNNYIHRARAIQVLKLRPVPKKLIKTEVHMEQQIYIKQLSEIPDFLNVLSTGCSVPNKVRNTSSILLRIDKSNSILLDCGEGTLGQIIRLYGISESDNILRSIKAIYISHIHADHQLGLIGLLLKRKQITNDKLYLLIPMNMIPWLNFYNDRFESISQQYILLNNSDLYMNHHKLSVLFEIELFKFLNIKTIDTVYVAHCKQAFGIAITLENDKKIVYSGDTMFCQNLINLGKDCDLLIHEATMEDELATLAKRKLHSTTSEAINAGKFMNAKFILLTHFSQRYSKIPFLPEKETNVGLAYDNMEITLSQLPLLPLFYPCIKIMFNEYNKVLGV